MKASIILLLLGAAALSAAQVSRRTHEDRRHFKDWCQKFNKRYRSRSEEDTAMNNLLRHKKSIDAHNKLYNEGKKSFKMRLSSHSDLTHEQIKRYRTGVKVPAAESNRKNRASSNYPKYPAAPSSVDWSEKGLVGPVRDQGKWLSSEIMYGEIMYGIFIGQCGSCWAFSTAAVVYSVMAKNDKQFIGSPQQLVDCDKTKYVHGCSGGWPEHALDYVKENGITTDEEYPYKAYDGTCEYTEQTQAATVTQVHNIPTRGNETWLA